VNRDVATGTLAAGLKTKAAMGNSWFVMKSGMALQAELSPFAPHQQHAIGAAVRIVASGTAFHLHRSVLVNVRAAFLLMAVHTALKIGPSQTGPVPGTVRIVAIGALHQAFGYAMVNRQRKLSLDRSVAVETQRRFRLLQQTAVKPADFVRELRHLIEMCLRILAVSLAQIFDLSDQVRGVTLIT
jgi:hypothetical protein